MRTDMIRYRPSDNLLALATHGRGVFTANLTPLSVTGIPTVSNTRNFISYSSAGSSQLLLKTGNLSIPKIQLRLFNAQGGLVLSRETKYADQYVDISRLPAGSYILKVYGTKGEVYTSQFVKR
jgi:hypothetical protein